MIHTYPKDISPKGSAIAQLKFELAIQHFKDYDSPAYYDTL